MSIARTIQIEKALTDCVTDVSKLMSIAGKHGDYLREIFSLIPSYATKTELMAAVTSMKYASNREGKENQIGNILSFLGENENDKKATEELQKKSKDNEMALKKMEHLLKEKDRQINEMQTTMESQAKQIVALHENENLHKSKTQNMEQLLTRLSEQVHEMDSRMERQMIAGGVRLDSMNMSVAGYNDYNSENDYNGGGGGIAIETVDVDLSLMPTDTVLPPAFSVSTPGGGGVGGEVRQASPSRTSPSSSKRERSPKSIQPNNDDKSPANATSTPTAATATTTLAGTGVKAIESDSESDDDRNKTPEQTLSKVLSEMLLPVIDDGSAEAKRREEEEEMTRLKRLSEEQALLRASQTGSDGNMSAVMSLELSQRFEDMSREVYLLKTQLTESISSLSYSIEQRKEREKLLVFDCEQKIEAVGRDILEECVRNTHRKTCLVETRLTEHNKEVLIRLANKYDLVATDLKICDDSIKDSNSRIEYVHESLRLLDREHSVLMSSHRQQHSLLKENEQYMYSCIDHLVGIVDTFIKNLLFAEVHNVEIMKLLERLRIEQKEREERDRR